MNPVASLFQLGFQISPIILTGGIAAGIPGGMLPVVSLTEAASFIGGILGGSVSASLDDFFAHYEPLPGSTLIDNQIGHYPFANQIIAANAIIVQPLRISLRMICPVNSANGYAAKLLTMTALQMALYQHNLQGGTYTVATPSFAYTNLVMLGLRDISQGESKQVQHTWQWDFEQPLITLQQAQQAQSSLMSKLTNGTPTDGSLSGPGAAVGIPPSGAAVSTIPAITNTTGGSSAGTSFSALLGQQGGGFSFSPLQ